MLKSTYEYGTFLQIMLITNTITMFTYFGLPQSIYYFFQRIVELKNFVIRNCLIDGMGNPASMFGIFVMAVQSGSPKILDNVIVNCTQYGIIMYFAEDGSLLVNDGEPAIGRDEIIKVAEGFMTDLPDMVVSFDSLVTKPDGVEFHWTLTATNTGPGGTGNKVKVSGFEHWHIGKEGLIKESQGNFPAEEYNRQLESGVD